MKKMFGVIVLLFLILLITLLISCSNTSVPAEKKCSADADCIQATCCHPTDVVNVANAPNCKSKLCTMECAPGTLDCGQGEAKCVQGECKAVYK